MNSFISAGIAAGILLGPVFLYGYFEDLQGFLVRLLMKRETLKMIRISGRSTHFPLEKPVIGRK